MRSRLPVLRTRRRYLVFELDCEDDVQPKYLLSEIQAAETSLLGDLGASSARLRLISFNGRFGILRCSHSHVKECRAALATIHSVKGTRAALHVKGISGTIRAAMEKYIPQLSLMSAENDGRRIELEGVSGWIIHSHGREIDLSPDDKSRCRGSDTRFLGLTSFDLCGGCDYADGTANGLRQGDNCIQP